MTVDLPALIAAAIVGIPGLLAYLSTLSRAQRSRLRQLRLDLDALTQTVYALRGDVFGHNAMHHPDGQGAIPVRALPDVLTRGDDDAYAPPPPPPFIPNVGQTPNQPGR